MNNYLSTDELIKQLEKQNSAQLQIHSKNKTKQYHFKEKKNKFISKKTGKIIYFVCLAIAILHMLYISIPLVSPSRAVNIVGNQYVMAVPNNQELGPMLQTKIVRIKPFNSNDLELGDQIVIYGKYGTDVFWVEDVVDIDFDAETLDSTFDGFLRNTYSFAEIGGKVIKESNLFGSIIFVSTRIRGYLSILATYTAIFGMVYYFYIRDPKKHKKENK